MKNQLIKLSFLCLFIVSSICAYSQGTLTGEVYDDFGDASIGAYVYDESEDYFTETDFDGFFELEMEPGTYKIIIEDGSTKVEKTVTIVDGQVNDLGKVTLELDVQNALGDGRCGKF